MNLQQRLYTESRRAPTPEGFVKTSSDVRWKGKIRCLYCLATGWPDPEHRNPHWWGLRHGMHCKKYSAS